MNINIKQNFFFRFFKIKFPHITVALIDARTFFHQTKHPLSCCTTVIQVHIILVQFHVDQVQHMSLRKEGMRKAARREE